MEHILTLETEKHFFQEQILPPLLAGESVTIFWVPHGGMRTQMVFLTKNSALFGFNQLGKFRIVYVNPYELVENSPEGYLQLMLYNLDPKNFKIDEDKSAFFLVKEKVIELLKENIHLVFILGGFEQLEFAPTFYNNLNSLWQNNRSKIHFIFCANKNILTTENLIRYDQCVELITKNLIYLPLFSQKDSLFVIKRLNKKYRYFAPKSLFPTIQELSGGHATLIISALRLISTQKKISERQLREQLPKQWGVKIVIENIWKSLSQKDKDSLLPIVHKKIPKNFEVSDYLLRLNIIRRTRNSWLLFSPLFESLVKEQKLEKQILSFDFKTEEVLVNGQPPIEKITLNEHRLLSSFLKHPNKLFSRDEIAEILWSKEAYDKYSDWAIDQNISLLRKKLEKLGVSPESLQTIKGRGYRWID